MTATDDHGMLPGHAERLLRRLETIESLSVHGRVGHQQHNDYAQRVHQLAHHLRAVLQLNESGQYASALVVVRAALEHHLMDRLILLANRHIVTYTKAKRKDAARWEADIRALQAKGSDISGWFWDRDRHLNVVHRGLHTAKSKKGRGQTISLWYFEADRYDPFVGPKELTGRLARPFWEKRQLQQLADEQAAAWRYLFRYDAVMKALRVNRLLLGRTVQVDVHYAFLSGFAHPSKRGYESLYGHNIPDRMGGFDHYASELLFLYVIVLAAAEIEVYGRMARRAPRLTVHDWDAVMAEVRDSQSAASYFWFLSGGPEMFDRIDTAHTPPGNVRLKWGRPKVDPAAIATARVRYYRDPLRRLVKLHQSYQEMSTGLVYRSPFERLDAQYR
jgi:hypothetical protein